MSYFPVVWLVIFLVRLAIRAAQSRSGGSGSATAPSAPPAAPGSQFGTANIGIFSLTLLFAPAVAYLAGAAASALFPESYEGIVFLIVSPASFLGTFALPHWLAWRVLGPWRLPWLGRWVLPFGLYGSVASREGARELYAARFGRGRTAWDPRGVEANLWSIAAIALRAESLGSPDQADGLLRLLRNLPRKARKSRRPAAVAAEALAWSALRRGEGRRAAARAEGGGGRGIWLARRLAEAQLERPASAPALLFFWVLAPERWRTLPWLRRALGAGGLRSPVGSATALARGYGGRTIGIFPRSASLPSPRVVGPARAHLAILAHAAAGGVVRTREVERLAEAWSAQLDAEPASAGLLRRALELGGHEISELPGQLRASLLGELEALAETAEGEWTAPEESLSGSLRQRAIASAFEAVEGEIEAFDAAVEGAESRRMEGALEELARWVGFRERVEHLMRKGGPAALHTVWYGGLRYTACNWGVFLVRQRGPGASWAAFFMHGWSAELATRVGDDEIGKLSQENAELTRARLA